MGYYIFLEPFCVIVNRNFEEWLDGRDFNEEQRQWLKMIREHIAASLEIRVSDFEYTPFTENGGLTKTSKLFGDDLEEILTDLTEKLVS